MVNNKIALRAALPCFPPIVAPVSIDQDALCGECS